MLHDYFDRYATIGMSKPILRDMFRYLHPDQLGHQNAKQEAIDVRCANFLLASDADPTLYFDLRWMNGPDGDKFESFWDVMGEFLQLEVGESADERRHGSDAISFASKFVSVPSLIREVTKQLHAKEGHESDPIPKLDCVLTKFTPNNPYVLTAGRFSSRFKIKRRVQTRCLRMEHEDAHWVACLSKYNKVRLVRVRNALLELGLVRGVLRVGCDDQKQMPVGLPGLPINSGARAHGPVAAPIDQRLDASDHDSHRQGAIIPSLNFLTDIPEHAGDSWYAGTPSIVLHCATFEKSDPFFHAANLLNLLRTKEAEIQTATGMFRAAEIRAGYLMDTLYLSLQTDGGADHRNTLLKVKLSLLALKRCLGLRRVDSERCAPNASATLVHERVFSLVNIGLQHASFARSSMDDDLEDMVRSLSSMAEIRHTAGVGPPPKQGKANPKVEAKTDAAATKEAENTATKQAKSKEPPSEEEEETGEASYEVGEIEAERFTKGKKEYLVRWAPPFESEEPSWKPATNIDAPEKVEAWRRLRLSYEELAAADALRAKEAEHAETQAAAKAEAEKAVADVKEAKRQRLREQFKAAIYKVIDLVKARITLLELKDNHIECPNSAPPELLVELHASLRTLDDQYDPKYSLMSQLKKMPVIEKCLLDPQHTFDSTYMLSLQDCDTEGCKFGCRGWTGLPTKAKEVLRCKPVLPMKDPNNPGHMYSFDDAAALPGGTSECDMPSKKDLDSEEMKQRRQKDKAKELHPSKVRATVICDGCGRPRIIFAKLKPSQAQLKKLDAYLESVSYKCGDALFTEGVEGSDRKLAEIFYMAEYLTCRDDMQRAYFNYGGLGGREEFEHVCARCGNGPEESPLIDKATLAAAATAGKMALPLCSECFEAWKGGNTKKSPVLVGRSNKVTDELERKETKQAAEVKAVEEAQKQKAKSALRVQPAPNPVASSLHQLFKPPSKDDSSDGKGSTSKDGKGSTSKDDASDVKGSRKAVFEDAVTRAGSNIDVENLPSPAKTDPSQIVPPVLTLPWDTPIRRSSDGTSSNGGFRTEVTQVQVDALKTMGQNVSEDVVEALGFLERQCFLSTMTDHDLLERLGKRILLIPVTDWKELLMHKDGGFARLKERLKLGTAQADYDLVYIPVFPASGAPSLNFNTITNPQCSYQTPNPKL